MPSLTLFIHLNGESREFPIPREEVTIGRAKTSTLCISDPSVSSHHAIIKNGYFEDIGSTNGTLYNNKPLAKKTKVMLKAGDKLELGEIRVKIEARGSKETPSTSRGGNSGSQTYESLFSGLQIHSGDRRSVSPSKLKGGITGLYFSASWCGPCRTFTPVLIEVYKKLKAERKKFEVVFCSSDKSEDEYNSYFGKMPWLGMLFNTSKSKRDALWQKFGVRGIPFLVLLDENGKTISIDGRTLITKEGAKGYPWSNASTHVSGSRRGSKGGLKPPENNDDLSKSKRFGKGEISSAAEQAEKKKKEEEEKMTVEELMTEEFSNIIGHESIKQQLRQFHKKVQLDKIRQDQADKEGKKKKKDKPLYHMIFQGPPGTGKTSMANLVSKLMVKMGLLKSDKVEFVGNALDLLAQYSGQTPGKVDAKVEEAKGGVLFIDEAYSIVKKQHQQDSFGKEAIETIMKHLDPPSCVFIFAGYEGPMQDFLKVNQGLSRRVPYRYTFETYKDSELLEIMTVLAKNKKEDLDPSVPSGMGALLAKMIPGIKETQNAGLIGNWIAKAQLYRDDRIDLEEARANPDLASLLILADFEACFDEIANTYVPKMDSQDDDLDEGGGGGPRIAYA